MQGIRVSSRLHAAELTCVWRDVGMTLQLLYTVTIYWTTQTYA